MMKIELTRNSTVSLIDQIYFEISERIESKLLKQGLMLPSIRKMAQELNVSIVTVHKAYTRLEREGYIEIFRGKGAFVRGERNEKLNPGRKEAPSPLDWQLNISDYIHRAQMVQYLQVSKPIQFATSVIYPKLLPTRYIGEAMQAILNKDPGLLGRYSETQGDPELRMEVQRQLKISYGLHVPYESVMITNGVQQGIDLVARSYVGPGDVVLMEQPCFVGAIDVMRSRGANIFTIPVNDDGMCLQTIEDICAKVKPKLIYTNPTFQNPTGTVMSEQNRKALLEIAEHYGILIIEDDAVGDLYFDDIIPPRPLKYWDTNGHVIYLKGYSKQISPGCRISAMVASGTVLERLIAAKSTADICSPLLTQRTVLSFLSSDKMKSHLQKLRIALEVRRDRLHHIFSTQIGDVVRYRLPKGGLNFWLELPRHMNSEDLLYRATEQNVSFLPGTACFAHHPQRNFIRLSFSSVPDRDLDEGAYQFCALIKAQIQHESDAAF